MHPIIETFGIRLSVFPFFLIMGIFACIMIYIYSKKYDSFYFEWIKRSSVYCVLGATFFGKMLYALSRLHIKTESIVEIFGGFVFYGGLIGAILGLCLFCFRKKTRFLDLLDTYMSILPLGQVIGRIGCYFNGCCYGREYDGFFSVRYIVHGDKVNVFPTWFFEAAFCFILFVSLFCISKRLYSGVYASIYMISYSIFRFMIEYYRGDVIRGVWNGISTSQYVSICIFVAGVILLVISYKIKEKNLMIIGRS